MTLRETESVLALVAEIESLRQQLAECQAALALKDTAIKGVLDDAEECEDYDGWTANLVSLEAIHLLDDALSVQPGTEALKAWLGEPLLCREDGRCQYAIDRGAEGMGHCPEGKCCMPRYSPKGLK